MGYYIDGTTEEKSTFLWRHGMIIGRPKLYDPGPGNTYIVLQQMDGYEALGIVYDQNELDRATHPANIHVQLWATVALADVEQFLPQALYSAMCAEGTPSAVDVPEAPQNAGNGQSAPDLDEFAARGRGTTRRELKLLCSLYMADDHGDQSVHTDEDDDDVRDWLDNQSREHGFDNWIDAYHGISK